MSRLALLALALSLLAPSALAAPRAHPRQSSDITISGPFATGINCPTPYNWSGGAPPYTLSFSNIDTPGRAVPVEVYPNITGTSFTWLPLANDTGQMLLLKVVDEQGDEGVLDWVVVETEEVC
ncbi:hypothetical protein EIP86_006070 [Pleurotus ostreatoroseus]|nr:hypothetical protein EIP86_006070 [Pleurotus ostreatoroseus]